MMHAVTVIACTFDVLGSNLSQDTEYTDCTGLPQSLQDNAMTVLQSDHNCFITYYF
jgi:hypothetical protein